MIHRSILCVPLGEKLPPIPLGHHASLSHRKSFILIKRAFKDLIRHRFYHVSPWTYIFLNKINQLKHFRTFLQTPTLELFFEPEPSYACFATRRHLWCLKIIGHAAFPKINPRETLNPPGLGSRPALHLVVRACLDSAFQEVTTFLWFVSAPSLTQNHLLVEVKEWYTLPLEFSSKLLTPIVKSLESHVSGSDHSRPVTIRRISISEMF